MYIYAIELSTVLCYIYTPHGNQAIIDSFCKVTILNYQFQSVVADTHSIPTATLEGPNISTINTRTDSLFQPLQE